ncbi:MAG TPA: zinc-binding dehydrogenase [Acidimicrobiales bacterium]|nr:zinc-binding dehydrogenase [Acidimicrobiales bacterium]
MKAVRIRDEEVRVEDVDSPEAPPDHAVVRITAAGVCHSDLHLAKGDWYGMRPESIGHEAIGIVESLGPGAERFIAVGDRVILGLGGTGGGYWCGGCEYCLNGQPRHCAQAKGVMGTFAEEFAVYAPGLVELPASVPDREAPLACGGLTAYGAIKKLLQYDVKPGRPIAIVGAAGGLGHYAIQLANAFGYRVVGVDVGEERLEFVRSMGAEFAVSPDEAEALVRTEFGVGVDASLVFAARVAGYDLGLKLLRKAGLFVGVGLPPTSDGLFQLDPFRFFLNDYRVIFSAVGTVQDMRELVDLAAAGKVRTHVDRTGKLSELPAIFDELAAGKYLGRAVITDLGG